jgi:hypothetical protein
MRFDYTGVVVDEAGKNDVKGRPSPRFGILLPLTGVRLTDRGNGDSFF